MSKLMTRSFCLFFLVTLSLPGFANQLRDGFHQKFLSKLDELEVASENFNHVSSDKEVAIVGQRDDLLKQIQAVRSDLSQAEFFIRPEDTDLSERLQQDVSQFNNFIVDVIEVAATSQHTLGQHKIRLFESYLIAAEALHPGRYPDRPLANTNYVSSLQRLFTFFVENNKLDKAGLIKLDTEKIDNLYQLKSMVMYLSSKDKHTRNLYALGLQANSPIHIECLQVALEEKYHNPQIYNVIYSLKSLDQRLVFEKLLKAKIQDMYYFNILQQLKKYDQVRAVTTLIEKKRFDRQLMTVALTINSFHKLHTFNELINNKVEKMVYFEQLSKTQNKAQLIFLVALTSADLSELKYFELLHRIDNEAQAEAASQLLRLKLSDLALYELALKLQNSIGKKVFLSLLKQPQPYDLGTFALAQKAVFENFAAIVTIIENSNATNVKINSQTMEALLRIKHKMGVRSLTYLRYGLQLDLNYLTVLANVTKQSQLDYIDKLHRANQLGDFQAFKQVLNY